MKGSFKSFSDAIDDIQKQILKMGQIVGEEVILAVESLVTTNKDKKNEVYHLDRLVDQYDEKIHSAILQLITIQPPLPDELHTLSTMIRISREFERIGDQAVNIADVSQHTDVKTNSQTFEMIHQMSKLTTMMLSQSIEILDSKNLELIPFISDREEGVDRYFHDIHHYLVSEMRYYPDQIESLANLLLVSRYLERSADHVVNVTRQIKKNEYWGESS